MKEPELERMPERLREIHFELNGQNNRDISIPWAPVRAKNDPPHLSLDFHTHVICNIVLMDFVIHVAPEVPELEAVGHLH